MESGQTHFREWLALIIVAGTSAYSASISYDTAELMKRQTEVVDGQLQAQKDALNKDLKGVFNDHLGVVFPKCEPFVGTLEFFMRSRQGECESCGNDAMSSYVECGVSKNPVELVYFIHHYEEARRLAERIDAQLSPYDFIMLGLSADRLGFTLQAEKHYQRAIVETYSWEDTDVNVSARTIANAAYGHFLYGHATSHEDSKKAAGYFVSAIKLIFDRKDRDVAIQVAELQSLWAKDELHFGLYDAGLETAKLAVNNYRAQSKDDGWIVDFYGYISFLAEQKAGLKEVLKRRKEFNDPIGICYEYHKGKEYQARHGSFVSPSPMPDALIIPQRPIQIPRRLNSR